MKIADLETIKWRLNKALRDVNTLPKWETLVQQVHKVTITASFFLRYCFIRALAEDPMFDLQVHFEKPIFFTELMKTFVDKPRGKCSTNETRMVRETIDHYLHDVRNYYEYEKQKIPGLQSNLFQYQGFSIRTSYLNNIQTHLTTHLHKTINCMLRVAEHRRQLRDNQAPEFIKSDIRLFLRDVSYFKYHIVDKIRYHRIVVEEDEGEDEVSEVMLELQNMGIEFVETFRCLANVLKAADHRHWVNGSLCLDIEQRPERQLATIYELSRVNERMGFRMFQPFPLK